MRKGKWDVSVIFPFPLCCRFCIQVTRVITCNSTAEVTLWFALRAGLKSLFHTWMITVTLRIWYNNTWELQLIFLFLYSMWLYTVQSKINCFFFFKRFLFSSRFWILTALILRVILGWVILYYIYYIIIYYKPYRL